jgi:HPt (histidine-containing phosphotransfer) domain-containing protein
MIDLSHLQNLLGDPAMVARFLAIFREQAPLQLAELRRCAPAGDWQAASIAAHGLKSQLEYLGMKEEAALAASIERLAEQGTLASERIEILAERVEEVLRS